MGRETTYVYVCIVMLKKTAWRNWIARWTSDPAVAGSNPVAVVCFANKKKKKKEDEEGGISSVGRVRR